MEAIIKFLRSAVRRDNDLSNLISQRLELFAWLGSANNLESNYITRKRRFATSLFKLPRSVTSTFILLWNLPVQTSTVLSGSLIYSFRPLPGRKKKIYTKKKGICRQFLFPQGIFEHFLHYQRNKTL